MSLFLASVHPPISDFLGPFGGGISVLCSRHMGQTCTLVGEMEVLISKGTLVQEMLGRRSEWDTVGTQKAVVRYVKKLGEPWSGAS